MKINLAGIELNSGRPDDRGAMWYLQSFSGWEGPGQRTTMSTSLSFPGQFLVENVPDTREITIGGICKTHGGEAGFWKAYNHFIGLTAEMQRPKQMTVYETVPKKVTFIRSSAPRVEIGVGHFTWELSLVCPDPFKYALRPRTFALKTTGTPAVTEIRTQGNYMTPVTLVPLADAGPSEVVRFLSSGAGITTKTFETVGLPAGTVIDSKTRTISDGAQNYYYAITPTKSDWFYIEPFASNWITAYSSIPYEMTFTDVWL